jgi:hypothetical protein
MKLAGIDAGKLLKKLLAGDKRKFEVRIANKIKEYKLVR